MGDVFLFLGVHLIIITTFFINIYAGCYVTALVFILLSIVFEKVQKNKKE